VEHHDCQPPDVQLSTDELPKLIDCEEGRTLREAWGPAHAVDQHMPVPRPRGRGSESLIR